MDPTPRGVLSLTFDDGPSERTSAVLDALADHGVVATFFFLGANIPGHRDLLRRMQRDGHQVASHGYYHNSVPTLSFEEFRYELSATKASIGNRDDGRLYYRFPYGEAEAEHLYWPGRVEFEGRRYRAVGWNATSHDSAYPAGIFDAVIAGHSGPCEGQPNPFAGDLVGWTLFDARRSTGGILLFHDRLQVTADSLDEIIRGLQDPSSYWGGLVPERRDAYLSYYECLAVEPDLAFVFEPLHGGSWPSLADEG